MSWKFLVIFVCKGYICEVAASFRTFLELGVPSYEVLESFPIHVLRRGIIIILASHGMDFFLLLILAKKIMFGRLSFQQCLSGALSDSARAMESSIKNREKIWLHV